MSYSTATNRFPDDPATLDSTTRSVATMCFEISADSDPGSLPRIIEPFAKRGYVMDRCSLMRQEDTLCVLIEVDDMDQDLADYIGRCIREVFVVRRVSVERRLS